MKLSLIVSVLSFVLSVQSTPVENTNAAADARKKYDIRWCKAEKYGSCKKYEDLPVQDCYDMDKDYNDNCVSVKHSKDVTCYYYRNKDCSGRYLEALGDYETLPNRWQNEISSWLCSEKSDSGSGGGGSTTTPPDDRDPPHKGHD